MSDERALVETLTEVEKEALRVFLSKSEVKESARVLGRHPSTIEQRLKRARRKLGVRRSIDAALMLARVETELYGSPVYASSDIAADPEIAPETVLTEGGGHHMALPFPTKGRPWNDSSIGFRIIAILVGMFFATASALLAASLFEQIDRIVRQYL